MFVNDLLRVDPRVADRFPTYRGLVLFAHDLQNGPSDERSRTLLREAEEHAKRAFAVQPLAEHGHIIAWREAYRAFGVKPQRMLKSAEALISRVLKNGELPVINRLVDAYNAVSVRHVVPCGGEDLAQVRGQVMLKFADGSESFETMKDGSPFLEHPVPGEVVWADDAGVTCRAWNWRQGTRTRLTEATTAAYFLFDTLAPITIAALEQAGDELAELVRVMSPGCRIERVLLGQSSF